MGISQVFSLGNINLWLTEPAAGFYILFPCGLKHMNESHQVHYSPETLRWREIGKQILSSELVKRAVQTHKENKNV